MRLIVWQAVQGHSMSGSNRATARLNSKGSTSVPLVPILPLVLVALPLVLSDAFLVAAILPIIAPIQLIVLDLVPALLHSVTSYVVSWAVYKFLLNLHMR